MSAINSKHNLGGKSDQCHWLVLPDSTLSEGAYSNAVDFYVFWVPLFANQPYFVLTSTIIYLILFVILRYLSVIYICLILATYIAYDKYISIHKLEIAFTEFPLVSFYDKTLGLASENLASQTEARSISCQLIKWKIRSPHVYALGSLYSGGHWL